MKILSFCLKNRLSSRQLNNCRDRLYRLAYSWCHDSMLADDLAQETLSKAMQKLHQLKNENLLEAWLFAILNNQWREHLRRSRPCEDIDDMVYMHEQTPEYWHDRQQVVDSVQIAIAELPIGQRQVITLVDIEGLSYLKVSEALGIPVGTVMSRLNRARSALQNKLQKKEKLSSITPLRSVK